VPERHPGIPGRGDYVRGGASFGSGSRDAGDFTFGIGTPVADPFLLAISYTEAATAVASVVTGGREALHYYEDIPRVKASYSYPLDLEENVMRAVRSGNAELLDSLLLVIKEDNFVSRRLSKTDTRNHLIELQGTALRLLNDLPGDSAESTAQLEQWGAMVPAPENVDSLGEVLHSLSQAFDRAKRSHNSSLVASLQTYVAAHYA
jgi:hypothetical protein